MKGLITELKHLSWAEFLAGILFLGYSGFFLSGISLYWFNPLYTTQEALQQAFPLYRALYRDAFLGDVITESMLGYLPPIHWWLSFITTLVTDSPVMTGHLVMFIQLVATLYFLYKLMVQIAGRAPAFFALTWYLHSRDLPMQITGGLPKGWGGVIIISLLFFLASARHSACLIVILIGILTYPPAALIVAALYGLYLLFNFLSRERRSEAKKPLMLFLILCPIFATIAFLSLDRPLKFGELVSLEEAEQNSAFSREGGRFQLVPLLAPWKELKSIGVQAFINRWHGLPEVAIDLTAGILLLSFPILLFFERKRGRELIPLVLKLFFTTIWLVYFASRFFAFKLYIPDRYLQLPLNLFWIVVFSSAFWRLFPNERRRLQIFGMLTGVLFLLGGTGLQGDANFNLKTDQRFTLYTWLKLNTERNAVIASHPTLINGVQLFAMRPAYITTETAHPLYSGYWKFCKERITTSLKLYYSSSPEEFMQNLGAEKIDYFVFSRASFTDPELALSQYNKPHDALIRKLALHAAKWNLPLLIETTEMRLAKVFDDGEHVVLDVGVLRDLLKAAK